MRLVFVCVWSLLCPEGVFDAVQSLAVALGLRSMPASVVAARRPSCSAACGILVSHQGIEPGCLALPGRFLTIGLPGKSLPCSFYICMYIHTYNMKIYVLYVSSCWVLHVKWVYNTLHLYSPLLIIAGFGTMFVCGWFPTLTVCELLPVSFPICSFLVSNCVSLVSNLYFSA